MAERADGIWLTRLSSIVSIICLALFLKVWQPRHIWHFPNEPASAAQVRSHPAGAVFKAWTPFILLTLFIGCWGITPVSDLLNHFSINIPVAGLHQMVFIPRTEEPLSAVFKLNWLSAGGTAILFAAMFSAIILKISVGEFFKTLWYTLVNLKYALFTITLVLGFAYLTNYSGLSRTLGLALTFTGAAFPFISAFIGWLGVFITGSDTSSNALLESYRQWQREIWDSARF